MTRDMRNKCIVVKLHGAESCRASCKFLNTRFTIQTAFCRMYIAHFTTVMLFFSLHFLPYVHYSFHYNYVVFLPTLSFIPFGGLVRQLSQSKCQLSQSMYRLRANAFCRNVARARTTIWSIWMAPRTWSLSVLPSSLGSAMALNSCSSGSRPPDSLSTTMITCIRN